MNLLSQLRNEIYVWMSRDKQMNKRLLPQFRHHSAHSETVLRSLDADWEESWNDA
jgi:hypothetical protein